MAFSLIAHTADVDTINSVTTDAIDTTGADLLVLCLAWFSTEPTVSDSKSNTWTQGTSVYSSGNLRYRLYYAKNATVGSGHTFTATQSGSYLSVSVSAWSGSDLTSPLDQTNGNGGNAASLSAGSVTPTEDGELIVAGWGNFNNGQPNSPSVNSGFTLLDSAPSQFSSGGFGNTHAYLIQSTAAAVNPTLSWTGGDTCAAAIATFKKSAAASSVPRKLTLLGVG